MFLPVNSVPINTLQNKAVETNYDYHEDFYLSPMSRQVLNKREMYIPRVPFHYYQLRPQLIHALNKYNARGVMNTLCLEEIDLKQAARDTQDSKWKQCRRQAIIQKYANIANDNNAGVKTPLKTFFINILNNNVSPKLCQQLDVMFNVGLGKMFFS